MSPLQAYSSLKNTTAVDRAYLSRYVLQLKNIEDSNKFLNNIAVKISSVVLLTVPETVPSLQSVVTSKKTRKPDFSFSCTNKWNF